MSWAQREVSKKTKQDPRDFAKLNIMCTGEGAHTAPQYYEFRKINDARIKYGVIHQKPVRLPSYDFTYGKKNRPQTPVGGIIKNDYGRSAAEQQIERYAAWKAYVS